VGAIEKIFSIAAAAFAQPTCAFDDLVLEEPLSGPSGIVLPRLDGGYGTSFSFSVAPVSTPVTPICASNAHRRSWITNAGFGVRYGHNRHRHHKAQRSRAAKEGKNSSDDIISDLGFSLIIAPCLIAKSRHKTTVNFDEDQNMPRLIEQRYPLECRCGSKTRHAGNLRSIAKMAREGRSAASRCRRLRPWCSRGGAAAGSVFGFAPCFVVEIGGICRFAGMRNNGSVGLLPPPSSKRTRVSRQALRCTSVTLGRRGW
jgi:hypothetical protein